MTLCGQLNLEFELSRVGGSPTLHHVILDVPPLLSGQFMQYRHRVLTCIQTYKKWREQSSDRLQSKSSTSLVCTWEWISEWVWLRLWLWVCPHYWVAPLQSCDLRVYCPPRTDLHRGRQSGVGGVNTGSKC